MTTSKKAVSKSALITAKGQRVKIQRSSGNVFKDLGFSDAEAESLQIRCDLMIEIEKIINANGWTQAQAAGVLKIAQPRISELMHAKIERFSVDTLLQYLNILGKKVTFNIKSVAA
jgi:predicted XRE-type DNA-binding protein